MPRYEVTATGAGRFRQGDVITEEQIVESGSTPDHWLGNGGVKEVPNSTPLRVSSDLEDRRPEMTTGNNSPGDPLGVKGTSPGGPEAKGEAPAGKAVGDDRTLYGHKLSVYRRKVGSAQGEERLAALQEGFDGVGASRAQEIADALDGK